MKIALIALALLFLASCAAPQPPAEKETGCPVFEIPSDGGCCRDLNENNICDTIDFAENISEEKQKEYEEAARKARETAAESGKLKRTIVNELHENASRAASYRFIYRGDEIVVANGSVVRKLVSDLDLGIEDINGRRQTVLINYVSLDSLNRKANATCIPHPRLVRQGLGTPCDPLIGLVFDVSYERFAVELPIKWLEQFLHRTPFETLTGTDIGKRKTTLYRFTALQDAQRKTSIWVDTQTAMPLRVEIWQGDDLVQQEWYSDFYTI